MQEAIATKKDAKKCLDLDKSKENKEQYKLTKKQAKKAVVESKGTADSKFYSKIETDSGRSFIFKVAKLKDKKSKDITRVHMIKNKDKRS